MLMAINPLAGDNIGTRWFWDELPSRVVNEGSVFVMHGGGPMGISKGGVIVRWKRRDRGDGR
jgi:hypothetical protein